MNRKPTKFLMFLLILSLAMPLAAFGTESQDVFVVGSTTGISGEFMSGMWGNNTMDTDVRILLHDYPTTLVNLDETVIINPVSVKQHKITEDEEGNAVHNFVLKDNLRFCDGSRITAKDYVFSVLLESAPQIREIGGVNTNRGHLKGAACYIAGNTRIFSGVRLLGDLQFSLTVKKEYLPYFYDLNYVFIQPYPAAVIAPGCEVKDDGEGAYIDGEFTAELLERTILAPKTGYLFCPQVTSGPYKLISCDRKNRQVLFEINPFYLGNHHGQKPAIQRILVREVKNDQIAQMLKSGEVHLVNKISSADVIDQVLEMSGEGVRAAGYPRNGFAYLHCSVERDIPSSQLFRQALSRLIDRNSLVEQFLRGYGKPVYAHYGLGQWMIDDITIDLRQFDKFPYDLAEAVKLLEVDGWTLNSQGGPYDRETDSLRYKRFDDELRPLRLMMGLTPDNKAAEILRTVLSDSLKAVGGDMEIEYLSMSNLLRQYYRQDERRFDLLFLGSNFDYVYDPYRLYQIGENIRGTYNASGIEDEHLLSLAKQLRETMPGDQKTFLSRWINFQDYWADALPAIPLYSNTYYDAFTADLVGYQPESSFSWAESILYASIKK